jgi:hypothetical protein
MTDHQQPPERPVFVLRIEGKPGAAGIHSLRALLKVLLRKYGFRCISAHEIPDRASPDDPATTPHEPACGGPRASPEG